MDLRAPFIIKVPCGTSGYRNSQYLGNNPSELFVCLLCALNLISNSGITSIRYAGSQMLGQQNNLKVFGPKDKHMNN